MKITDYAFPVAFLVIFAICAAIALVNGAGGIKKLLKGQRINRKTCVMSVIALALAVGTLIPSVAMWPRAVDDGSLTNAETGLNVTFDDPAIPMSGDRTNAQLDEFLREGFGEDYEAVWNGNDADVFMFTSDQDKILANEAYLQSLGLKDTGFRNGVCFPTTVLTAEVIKDLPNMTDEERAEVFNQHRWLDVYWHIMTIPGYCDMWVQDLEEYPEYVEQNDRWLPALKELLAEAKASPDGMYSLLVKEDDGTEHYCDAYRYGAAKVCASLENAVIRGVAMDPQSIMNWELPSFSPEIADRWTVKLTEPEDQENKPAAIWAFPNVKSGQDAYTDGVNLADLRAEKFAPKDTVVKIDNPDPGTPPAAKTHKVWSHHVIKGSNANLENSPVYQEIAEGKDWQTTWRTYPGYTYDSCSHKINGDGVVTGTMGTEDIHVYFYYTPNQDTKPTYVNLTVLHVDEHTGNTISQTGPNSYVKGAEQAASKENIDYYVYAGYYTINGGSKVYNTGVNLVLNEDTVVRFYYNPEYMLTTKFVDVDTGEEIRTRAYDYFVGGSQFTTTAPDNIDDYERVSNSETSGNPKTVTGTMPYSDKAVTFYYKKVVANQTVTAYYRAIDSNHNLTEQPIVQTKKVGESYSTQQLSFPGYRFRYTTGSPTSGTVGNQPIVVTYWYELIKQDGNNNKDPGSDPTQNGTGNANPPKGPDDTSNPDVWQPTDPDNGTRVPEQSGDEPTSNHRPTDNPGGQAAGSDERQEVSDETVNGIVGDNQETPSSGTGGQDPGHVDTGATEVPGGGYTPPAKEEIVPDNPPSSNDPVIGADEVLAEP